MAQQKLPLGLPSSSLGNAAFLFLCVSWKEAFKQLPESILLLALLGSCPEIPITTQEPVLQCATHRSSEHLHGGFQVHLNCLPSAALTLEGGGCTGKPRSV